MSVYLRGKSYYYDFHFHKTRYRGSFGPVSKADAIQAEAVLRAQAATGELPGQQKPSCTWDTMSADLLLYSQNNCRWTTLRLHEQSIKSLEPFFRDITPADIRPEHVEAYKRAMLGRGLKKISVNAYLKTLRQMLNRAYEAGYLKELPIRRFRLLPGANEPRTRVYSHEEEARLLMAAPAYLRDEIILALNTGMRPTEIVTLQWERVDFVQRLICIPSELSKNHKEGLVPINGVVFNLLSSLKPSPAQGRVFPNKTWESQFLRARIKAGLDPELKFYSLRHTFATRLYEAGVVLVTVKELMRHSDVAMTLRYTHAKLDHLRRAVDLLTPGPKQPNGASNSA